MIDAITALLSDPMPPDLPECVDGLSLGGGEVFPCYEIRLE